MKRILILLLLLPVFVQAQEPVKWTFETVKAGTDSFEVRMTATLEEGWHVFSQSTPEGGPLPTAISFKKNPLLQLQGKTREIGKLEEVYEAIFGVDVKQYAGRVTFVQVVKKLRSEKAVIEGTVEFMACNEEICLPSETLDFSLELR